MTEFGQQIGTLPPDQEAIRARCFHPIGTFFEFPREEIDQSIPGRFEKIVGIHPDRLAVKTRQQSLTYDELNQAANQVAHAILDRSGSGQQPVALLFENGAPFVVASLGALKAGKIQVSLENSFPRARLRYMLEHSQATVVVTDNENLSLARQLADPPVVNINEIRSHFPVKNVGISLRSDASVAIAYTSGSTGQPKGVVWNHRGVLHAVRRQTNMFHICADDRLVMCRASLRPYLYAVLNGATYYPVDLRHEEGPALAEWLINEKITVYRAVVSAFRSFAGVLAGTEKFPHLRLILLFGEPVYPTDVELYLQRFANNTVLGSTLGCLEFDDYAYFFVDSTNPHPAGALPGGYPTADATILVLDDSGRPVPPEQIGEIAISSRYNPVGFWRSPQLTKAKFLRQAEKNDERIYLTGDLGRVESDGCLLHHGRKDFDIKVRGYRVNVAEVETALMEIDGVKQAVVVGHEDKPGNKRLVAYIIPTETHTVTVTELRRILGEKLPDYMVPAVFITIPALPLTATGKVDRRALPPPPRTRPVLEAFFVAPRTPVEEKLAQIWGKVLDLDRLGVHDSFLDLGGDSLLATRIIARILSEFRIRVPVRLLFDAATVADMARVIEKTEKV